MHVFHEAIVDDESIPISHIRYSKPKRQIGDVPQFEIKTDNKHGRHINKYGIGKNCDIYRNKKLVFPGEIEPRKFSKSTGNTLTISGRHRGYIGLEKQICDVYRAVNQTYSPVVNPWSWKRYKVGEETLDGVRPDDVVKCLIGTKMVWQDFFDNFDYMRYTEQASIYNDANTTTSYLRAPMINTKYQDGGYVESIPITNGDSAVTEMRMGDISGVSVKLYGYWLNTSSEPILKVSRNQGWNITTPGDGDYYGVTLTWHVVSDAFGYFDGSYTFTDTPSVKNCFGYQFWPNSATTQEISTTNLWDYIRFDIAMDSDTGVTEGDIDAYDSTTDTTIEVDYAGFTRLEALSKLQELSVTTDGVDGSYWDLWVDENLACNFKAQAGTTRDDVFSTLHKDITMIDYNYDAKIKNIIYARGKGTAPYWTTLVGDTSALYDQTSIDTYGPKIAFYIDQTIGDPVTLYKKAKVYLNQYKYPTESCTIKLHDWDFDYDIGDRITVFDADFGVNNFMRIQSISHEQSGTGAENITVELGEKRLKAGDLLSSISKNSKDQEVTYTGAKPAKMNASNGLVFDASKYAMYQFDIERPENTRRVTISARTEKFVAYAKSAKGGGGSYVTSAAGGAGVAQKQAVTGYTEYHTASVTGSTGSTSPNVTGYSSSGAGGPNIAVYDNAIVTQISASEDTWYYSSWTNMASTYVIGENEGIQILLAIYGDDEFRDGFEARLEIGEYNDGNGIKRTIVVDSFGVEDKDNPIKTYHFIPDKVLDRDYSGSAFKSFRVGGNWRHGGTGNMDFAVEGWLFYVPMHTHGDGTYQAASHSHGDGTLQTYTRYPIANAEILTDLAIYYNEAWTDDDHTKHVHDVDVAAHVHNLDFGIYEFDYYPMGVTLRVDSPSASAAPMFGTIGKEDSAVEINDVDISDLLKDADGKFIGGRHILYFNAQTTSNNPKGLGRIFVTHRVYEVNE